MTNKLVVYGDVALDVVVHSESIPGIGADVPDSDTRLFPGGSAANFAVTAARLGADVQYVGLTGDDALSQLLVDDLAKESVDTSLLRRSQFPPAIIVVIVCQGERTFYSSRGAMAQGDFGPIPDDLLAPGDWLHLSGYGFQDARSRQTALALIDLARQEGARVSLDPSFHSAGQFHSWLKGTLPDVDYVFPNETEARLMTGCADSTEAARRVHAFGPQHVVVKLGERGCLLCDLDNCQPYPTFQVEQMVDVIGAGDAFCAGFVAAKLRGLADSDACHIANAVAAQSIQQPGGHGGNMTLGQVAEWLSIHGLQPVASRLGIS